MNVQFFCALYKILIRLYPRAFQELFALEMLEVFRERISEAAPSGRRAMLQEFTGELGGLLGGALAQQISRLPFKRIRALACAPGWQGPPVRQEVLLTLAVFILPVLCIWHQYRISAASGWISAVAGVLFCGILLSGILKGFPRWSLPYLGLALSGISLTILFQWGADALSPAVMARFGIFPTSSSARIVMQSLWAGLMWLSLFVLAAMLLGLLSLMKRFRSLITQFRNDWTLASLMLYGGALASFTWSLSQRKEETWSAIISIICLSTGALLYLHSPRAWQRAVALLTGITLAIFTASAGRWALVPVQSGPAWEAWPEFQMSQTLNFQGTVLEWCWMSFIVMAPALCIFLFRSLQRPLKPPLRRPRNAPA